jgi:hypothetical protein
MWDAAQCGFWSKHNCSVTFTHVHHLGFRISANTPKSGDNICCGFWGFGSLVESTWVIMLWLRLTATSNCFPHPHETLPHEPLLWASAQHIRPSPCLSREFHCKEWAYQSASNILRKSWVPAFVLPGDNSINNCDEVLNAEELWKKYFWRIDERWDHDFEVTRWETSTRASRSCRGERPRRDAL